LYVRSPEASQEATVAVPGQRISQSIKKQLATESRHVAMRGPKRALVNNFCSQLPLDAAFLMLGSSVKSSLLASY